MGSHACGLRPRPRADGVLLPLHVVRRRSLGVPLLPRGDQPNDL